jgi:hypothetical protein
VGTLFLKVQWATIVVALLLAGCLMNGPGEEGGGDEERAEETPAFRVQLSGCTDALVLGALDTDVAQGFLPAGFHAADGSAFLLGPDAGAPTETGRTIAYIDAVSCSASSLGGAVGVGHNGIQVHPPRLTNHTLGPATYEFYMVEQYYSHPDLVALLTDHEIAAVQQADVASMHESTAGPLGTGSGRVADRAGPLYSFEYERAAPSELDGLVRLWYVAPEGVGYWPILFQQAEGHLGAVTACAARAGSFAATLLGTACDGNAIAAGVWLEMSFALEFIWLEGVYAVP